jgi:hypothetical protein
MKKHDMLASALFLAVSLSAIAMAGMFAAFQAIVSSH